MKQKTLFLVTLLLFAVSVNAQLILTQSNFYVSASHDTVFSVSPGMITPPDPSASFWDYSNLPSNNTVYLLDTLPNSSFPTAQTAAQVFSAFGPLQVLDFLNRESTPSGYIETGNTMPQQTFSLETFTANPADNITFPAQDYVYSSPFFHLKYPVSPASIWTSGARKVSNFTLTVTSSGLNNAPSKRITNIQADAEVAGWGQIVVPVTGGGTSIPYDVLLIREHKIIRDSFLVNNMPAPTPLLNAFGLSQGQTIHVYTSRFYYTGNERPFLEIDHDTDSSYQNVISCYFMKERVQSSVSVDESYSKSFLSVYPNPSSTHQIYLNNPENTEWESCNVYNSSGQKVFSQNIIDTNSLILLNLPESLPAGMYHIQMKRKGTYSTFSTSFFLSQ